MHLVFCAFSVNDVFESPQAVLEESMEFTFSLWSCLTELRDFKAAKIKLSSDRLGLCLLSYLTICFI